MIEIQLIRRDSLYEVAVFLDKCWKAEYRKIINNDFLNEMKPKDRYKKLLKRFDEGNSEFLSMFDSEKMIGVSILGKSTIDGYENDGEISAIYLESGYIGKGYGHKLFVQAEKILIEKGFEHLVLDVFTDNMRAVEFYLKHGYEKVSDGSIKFGDCNYPFTVMRKKGLVREIK